MSQFLPVTFSRRRIYGAVSSLITFILIIFIVPAACLGYGFHDALNYGNSVNVISIRSAALVGIRVFGAEGASAVFLNPASLSNVNSFNMTASTSMIAWSEEVCDSTSITQRSGTGLCSITGAVAYRTGPDLVIGAGVAKVSDHRYDGIHFLPYDPAHPGIDIIEMLKAKGGLWEALGGVSWSISDNFAAGVSGGLRFGEVSYDYVYDQMFTPYIDSTCSWSWELSEACCHAGFLLWDDELSAGMCFNSGSADRYYSSISIAGRARAEHIGNTTIGFEGEIVDPFDNNFFNGKLSIETPIRGNMNIFAGVGFNEGENMNRVGLAFSVGGNYHVGRMRIDCALSHSGRSRESRSFPDEYSDFVDDSWTHFCIGLQYVI
ncbi:MAG: hypothetical protein GQ565_12795 [Candidatus Aegiribacteria sp.]|nr:hypothetical protein [Candidatus Aegiribacteria sp.]